MNCLTTVKQSHGNATGCSSGIARSIGSMKTILSQSAHPSAAKWNADSCQSPLGGQFAFGAHACRSSS